MFKLLTSIVLFFSVLLQSITLLADVADNNPQITDSDALVIGIFPRRDPALSIRLFKPLKELLEQKTNRRFILETSPNFKSFKNSLRQRRYDLVHFNQFHYVKSHDTLKYDVLVQNEEFGENTIRGGIYVRKDSGIDSLQQLRGKSILFGGGKEAMMSYIVPLYLIYQAGLKDDDFKPLFTTSPPNSILATYTRQVIASGAGDAAIRLPVVTKKIDTGQLKALALSEGMAHLPWAIKRELPDELKQQIQQILLDLKTSQSGREVLKAAKLTAFNPVSDQDYNQHRDIIDFVEASQSRTY